MQVDLIHKGQAQGEVANTLVANGSMDAGSYRPFINMKDGKPYISAYTGGDPNDPKNYMTKLVTMATLRRDEWKQLDEAVVQVARYRLGGIQDLIDKNLVYTIGNGMGTTVLEWHDVGDTLEADLTMDGITRAQNSRPNYQANYLPLPILHADYEINTRALSASRNQGAAMDVTLAENATRRISEYLENMLFTNISYSYGQKDDRNRNTIYSYVNFPDRVTRTITSWTGSAKSAADMITDVRNMKQDMLDINFHGPFQLYVPSEYDIVLDEDYDKTAPAGTTVRERIMKIDGINGIKVIDSLPTDTVLLVQMTPNVVRLVRGMPLQNVEWQAEGKFINKYKVMTIQVPQIRSDQNGKTGICHASV